MKRPILHYLVAGSFLFSVFVVSADDSDLFDDRFYVAPMGSLTGNRGDSNSTDGWGGGLAIGRVIVPHFGVELVGDYLRYRGKSLTTPTTGLLCGILSSCPNQVSQLPNQSVYGGGLGLNLYTSPTDAHGVFLHLDAEGGDRFVYNAGLGFDQPFLDRAVYLRAELLYHKEADFGAQPLFHLGVRLPFGGLHAPAQPEPPPPVAVVPVEQPAPAPEAPPPAPAPAPCQPPAPGQPISFEGCKTGDTIVLHGVNFEFNKATLTVNAKTLLDQVADALLARKDIKVEVDGHTDGKGSVPYNQKLSEARASAVMKYLTGRGIDAARMSSKGFGKSMPIADNATDEGRELNRRVELRVTDSGSSSEPSAEGQPGAAPAEAPTAPAGEGGAASSDSTPPTAGLSSAPVEKHARRHHKPAPPVEAPPAAETPAQSEPLPVAPDSSPDPAGSGSAADQSAPPASSTPAAAPSEDAVAPTEPAPAPPDASSPQADKPK